MSIYRKILETNFDIEALKNLNLSDGSYEYNIITKKESIKSISTRQLNNALDDFYVELREDVYEESIPREELLANSDLNDGASVVLPKVV